MSRNRALLATGFDTRGLVFALLDLADRVQNGAPLLPVKAVVEKPQNRIRSWSRLFTSDVEDKPWYNDREMWPQYLTMLATHRFNRFHLALGIGYDFIRQVTDAYFLFAYPFLLDVPGYKVRAVPLPDSERDANLKMLQFISEQTVARGPAACSHTPAATFRPGQPLTIELSVAKSATAVSARLQYRRVTQAERYQSAEVEFKDGRYRAIIPGGYTDSPYPLEYYFELKQGAASAWLFPGFTPELTNQPYYVVRRA